MTYTYEHPSPEYHVALELGKQFQRENKTFTGKHCFQQFPILRHLIQEYQTRDLIDFGCGKLSQFSERDIRLLNKKGDTEKQIYPSWKEALGVDDIYPYDPCIPATEKLPSRQYGGLYSTDVVEHIPPADLSDWVIPQMFSLVTQWVFCSAGAYPGKKKLADGSLAHKCIESVDWWVAVFSETAKQYPSIFWELRYEPDVPPISHRRFHGKGEWWEETEGYWQVWKPSQLEALTPKQREELEMLAQSQRGPIDPRAFGRKS